MALRICTVDHTANSAEAVSVAIERSAKSGDELLFVGVVQPFAEAPGPAYGERVRRFGLVEINLVHACRAARAAGLDPTLERRYGHLLSQAVAAADETGRGRDRPGRAQGALPARRRRRHGDRARRLERRPLALVA